MRRKKSHSELLLLIPILASPIAYGDHLWDEKYFSVNLDGCKNLVAGFKAVDTVKGFVYTSSAPIIAGSGGSYSRADETYPTLAVHQKGDPYHVAKALADKFVLEANDPHGIRTACIRPTAMYGEGDRQMIPHTLNVIDSGRFRRRLRSYIRSARTSRSLP